MIASRTGLFPISFAACLAASCVALDDSELDDVGESESELLFDGTGDSDTSQLRSIDPGLFLPPISSRGFWMIDFVDSSVKRAWKDGTVWRWPLAHDLRPTYVHMTWAPNTTSWSSQVPYMAVFNGTYTVELWINGVRLTRAADGTSGDFYTSITTSTTLGCPSGMTCLGTSVNAKKFLSFARPWNVKLVYRSNRYGAATYTATATFDGNPSPYSYFKVKLIPTFRHANCTTCHALSTETLLEQQHGTYAGAVSVDLHQGPNGSQLRCFNGCHDVASVVSGETFNETVWMAPGADQDINFNLKTDSQICAKVKQRLPTDDAKLEHFLEDARIAWAVHSGALPLGVPGGSKAPPYSFWDFQDIVVPWIAGGSPCP
jgi:hypothetical protein